MEDRMYDSGFAAERFVQITTSTCDNGSAVLYALDDSGQVWEYWWASDQDSEHITKYGRLSGEWRPMGTRRFIQASADD